MNDTEEATTAAPMALDLFHADPNALHSLDTAARLAGAPRRAILVYCRAGLVRAVIEPESGMMAFTEETIRTVRQIERLRAAHNADLALIKSLLGLLDEVERLRSEVRFLRQR